MQIEHKKNTAYYLSFPMVDSSTPASFKSSVSPVDTGYYKDGAGAWTSLAITDTASEIGATGVYEIDLTAAEMNHDQVMIKFSVAGAADTAFLFDMRTKLTDDLNDITAANVVDEWETQSQADPTGFHVNVLEVGGTAQTANDNGADINAILADTNELQGDWTNGGRLDLLVDAILADTNELQGDWADGGRLDLLLDAVLADTGTDGVAISATVANQIADAILNRDFTSVSDTNARTALNALRFLRNKWSIAGTTLTVTKEDDSTSAWTATVSTDATADPVTGNDPA